MKEYPFHEVSMIFPLIEGDDFAALVEDIRAHGLRERIWLHEGQIIDGRNRYRACLAAGVEPIFRTWNPAGSLTTFVLSLNLHRRHLSPSQLAMVGAKAKEMFVDEALGRRARTQFGAESANSEDSTVGIKRDQPESGRSRELAASTVNISPASIERASTVLSKGAPELVSAVEDGRVSVTAAAKIADRPVEEQRRIVSQPKPQLRESLREIQEEQEKKKAPVVQRNFGTPDDSNPDERERLTRKIAAVCGGDAGVTIRWSGSNFSDRDVKAIAALEPEAMLEVFQMRRSGWSTQKAIAFLQEPVADKILLSHTLNHMLAALREHGSIRFEGRDYHRGAGGGEGRAFVLDLRWASDATTEVAPMTEAADA